MRCLLATILLVVFLISPLSAQELTGTLQQIQKTGKMKIGYRKSKPPMSFLDKNGAPVGYTIDICKQITSAVKDKIGKDVHVEYIPVTAEERFNALAENKIDILCGATTKTLSRSEVVDFTQLTFVTGGSFMTLKGKNIRNNFDGKKVGVLKATTTASTLKELFAETQTDVEIVLLKSTDEGFTALQMGKIDALAADQVVLIGLALTSDDPSNYSIFPNSFSYEPFALAVRKNDSAFRLIADRVISHLYRSHQIRSIYDEWLGKFSNKTPTAFEALIQINAIPEN